MEDLKQKVHVLDEGYVQLVEAWGSDQAIIEGARMSTDKGFLGWGPKCDVCGQLGDYQNLEGWSTACPHSCPGSVVVPGDEKLLAYLWNNRHSTPFEMAGLTIEVQAPIFVFREWHRHRVPFGYSELSARYTPMPNLNYVPTVERLLVGSDKKNKQAGTVAGAAEINDAAAEKWQQSLEHFYEEAEALYQVGLAAGVPKELARICVPVGRYSRMRATGNLRGWLAFLALRNAPTAQYEIRVYAEVVDQLIKQHFPRTHKVVDQK